MPGFYRPVLKLEYFSSNVEKDDNHDGWCEHNGFLLGDDYEPPVIDWFDHFHHWWPIVTVGVLMVAALYLWHLSSRNTRRRGGGRLKPKRR